MITYSLFKHKDGRSPNYYCLYQHPLTQKQIHFSCRTSDEEQARMVAERRLPEILTAIYRKPDRDHHEQKPADEAPLAKNLTLSEYYEYFVRNHRTKTGHPLRDSSRKVYRDGFNRLIRQIGDVYIHTITADQCYDFIHAGESSLRTAEKHHINLRAAFRRAVDDRFIQSNPFDGIPCPRPIYSDEEIEARCFHAEDFEVFLREMKQRTPAQQRLRRMLILIFETGLRLGEARNLRHDRYDLDKKRLRVSSTRAFHTKTRTSSRTIPLSDTALRVIADQREANMQSEWVQVRQSEYLFPSPSGGVLTEGAIEIPFRKERERIFGAGCKHRIHGLRHALVTRLSIAGTSDRQIQEISGHSSLEMIQRYSHMGARLVDPIRHTLNDSGIKIDL